MRFKTTEEYVLNELEKTQEELQLAKKKIEELEGKLLVPVEDKDMLCIHLSDKPNYWYNVILQNSYNWEEILRDNNKDIEYVKEALESDEKLLKLAKLKGKTYWGQPIGQVEERVYNYLLKDREGRYSVIVLTGTDTYLYQCNKYGVYLSKEEGQDYMLQELRKYAKNYIESHMKKQEGGNENA